MTTGRNHFAYLLRMIREDQKKTISEWNALIRTALIEIDEEIRDVSVSERNAVFTFEEYRNRLQNLGARRGFDMRELDAKTAPSGRKDRTVEK